MQCRGAWSKPGKTKMGGEIPTNPSWVKMLAEVRLRKMQERGEAKEQLGFLKQGSGCENRGVEMVEEETHGSALGEIC